MVRSVAVARFLEAMGFALLFVAWAWAHAQGYPARPIRVIVGQAAGGGTDLVARMVAAKMADSLRQPILVENKPGSGGIVGTEFVVRSQPDGYTLLVAPSGTIVVNPVMHTKLPHNPARDLAPVSLLATFPLVLIVGSKQPVATMRELIDFLKANPTKGNYAGSGGAFQLVTELLQQRIGSKMVFIPYKGSNESVMAVVSGDVLVTMVDIGPAVGALRGGRVKGLAVTSPKRLASFADVPTTAEVGFPELETQLWFGMFAPASTPAAIVRRLEEEVNRIVRLPDIREGMSAKLVEATGSTSEELGKIVNAEIARWSAVAKAANIRPND